MSLQSSHTPGKRSISRRFLVILLSFTVLLVAALPAVTVRGDAVDAGDLDPTFAGFGNDGLASTGELRISAIALQDDGKIVAAGAGLIPNEVDLVPMWSRFYPTGSFENFDGGLPILGFYGTAHDVAIQPDGKIVLAGIKNANNGEGSARFFVARFHSNGDLDTGFGLGGVRLMDVSSKEDGARSVALQDDGKIVAAGYASIGGDRDFAVIRLNSDGSPDSSFSGDGMVTTGFGGCPGHDGAEAVAIQPDGKILVGGYADDGGLPCINSKLDFGLARYNNDGTLDTTFHNDGKRKIDFNVNAESIVALDIDPNNRIVAAGYSGVGSNAVLAAAVLNYDGTLDKSWDDDGKWAIGLDNDFDSIRAVQWQEGGKVLMAAHSDDGALLIRLDEDGEFDSTFDDDGMANAGAGLRSVDMTVQPDGRPIVARWPNTVARFLPNGRPDKAGKTMANYYPGEERAFAVDVQPDGSVVIAGEAESPAAFFKREVVLVRYKWDGQIDTTFGENGRAIRELANDDAGRDIIVQPDGKLLVAGFREQKPDYDFVIWRFESDGTVDKPFGQGGMAQIDFGGDDYGQAIVLQPDGKIVIAGFTELSGSRWLTLARVDAQGDLDLTFGNNGKFTRSIGGGYVSLRNLTQLPGGDLLAVGGHAGDFYALRLDTDGDPVASFGSNGYAEYPLSGNDEAWAVDSFSSGRFVIAGGSNGDFMLLFVEADGSMCFDPCGFFGESRMRVDFGLTERAYDVDIQDNNRILMVGGGDAIDPVESKFLLARIAFSSFPTPGYKLDTSFGNNGKKTTSFRGRTLARSAVLYSDKIIVAGYADNGHDDDFAVVRYLNDSVSAPPTEPPEPTDDQYVYLPLMIR